VHLWVLLGLLAPAEQQWNAMQRIYSPKCVIRRFTVALEVIVASWLLQLLVFNQGSHLDTIPEGVGSSLHYLAVRAALSLRCSHADVCGEHKCSKGLCSCWAAVGGHARARQSDGQTRAGEQTAFFSFKNNNKSTFLMHWLCISVCMEWGTKYCYESTIHRRDSVILLSATCHWITIVLTLKKTCRQQPMYQYWLFRLKLV